MALLTLIILFFLTGSYMAQDYDFANRLYYDYEEFKETSLTHRRFKHRDIKSLIDKLDDNFNVQGKGFSAERREIYLIKIGTGKKKVFLWSQMHGDEPTATMALFDMFNFFSSQNNYANIKEDILSNVTIYFMPMVNPDGAEIYKRRNIFDIDINRDAVRQATPEGIILRTTFEELQADFGVNLHDQSTRYTAGVSGRSAAISFLAPAFNYEKSQNDVREKATRLTGDMINVLSRFIPGHIAKYNDDFEPRAFGDNFQKWGTSTILIESGGWRNDPEKQFLRKLNFIAILTALKSISDNGYMKTSTDVYEKIPFNERYIIDLIVRGLKTKKADKEFIIDVGINRNEINIENSGAFYYRSNVEDLGDLSVFYGYEDYDFTGFEIEEGKILDTEFTSIDEVKKLDYFDLFSKGYTGVYLNSYIEEKFIDFPLNIYLKRFYQPNNYVDLGETPNYVIKKEGEVLYVIVNGFIYNLKSKTGEIKNSLIYK
jgi:hypothetical protein